MPKLFSDALKSCNNQEFVHFTQWTHGGDQNSLRIKITVNNRKIQQTLGPWLSRAFSMWDHVITSRHECMYVTLYLWVLRVFASSHWQSMSQNYPRTINIFNFPFYHVIAVITLCWNRVRVRVRALLYTRVLYTPGVIYIYHWFYILYQTRVPSKEGIMVIFGVVHFTSSPRV